MVNSCLPDVVYVVLGRPEAALLFCQQAVFSPETPRGPPELNADRHLAQCLHATRRMNVKFPLLNPKFIK